MSTADSSAPAALDAALLALRPPVAAELPAEPAATTADFLHRTLRPLLKLQNPRLLAVTADFLLDHHVPFQVAGPAEQQRLLAELLTRNVKLRYTIVGLVTGLFTAAEMRFYRSQRAEVNRRLLELAVRRVQDQASAVAALLAASDA
ncbi:hypothetical protein [Hymenobacter weizhouensis]|uniref:hypothetical protein n=1 Tax=Hymenobacter sp. YIM 151500-1 TaxID=2987689 RepID=UPI00222653FC|nr:hypothetical protein [Hymenobacter sp. YIM 151500-1]UYZ62722.1 hypothetical protein OIS53_17190 [Hymenobacter sp. YIM 151500-1]